MNQLTDHFKKDIEYHAITADLYDHVTVEPREFANRLLFSDITKLMSPGDKMLDLGCGTGHIVLRYGQYFKSILAVDHSEDMLNIAKKKVLNTQLNSVQFQRINIINFLAKETDKYDFISCVGFLHHLPLDELEKIVLSIKKLLNPKGQLLVAEPIVVDSVVPAEIQRWNAKSVMQHRSYPENAVEPDEAPIDLAQLQKIMTTSGLIEVHSTRGHELFPENIPATMLDKFSIWYFHRKYGTSGNIFAGLYQQAFMN
jgi:2-polyprenyl-3-methyl-5-hydroxy-6-metoxy-1,4-benzoquinol methylase